MPGYNHAAIEKKWQALWASHKVFTTNIHDHARPKYYVLDMFPYPSGQGLHVGHPEGYTATDIIARYKRANGFNVMHPMGWDAFGLPAEQYAIKNNVHPRETTAKNINRFREQLQAIGFSYDWSREVDTTDPRYYRWTQWIFLKLYDTWFDESQQKGRPIRELVEEFKTGQRPIPQIGNRQSAMGNWDSLSPTEQRQLLAHYRLAYEAEVPVNWCPGLGTVLANEEVIDGKSEVGGFPVERRPMKQWMLRITAYAQRLLAGLHKLDWSDSLKEMQRNWIGRSEGAEVTFKLSVVSGQWSELTVFTTRPDTLFGATYMVIAPEHSLANSPAPEQAAEVRKYQKYAASRSDRERQEDTSKTGAFTGLYAINPVNNKQIPIWVSDYVLMGYGTGAIMAVPAHDQRDHEFATKFNLPIIQVVAPRGNAGPGGASPEDHALEEEGIAINSPWIDGLPTPEAKKKITAILEEKNIGKKTINYKLRDWLFSRQRYWGEPFPIVHLADGTNVALSESELPVKLPELEDFKPTGTIDPPLSKAKDWVNVRVDVKDLGGDYVAHLDTSGGGGQPARRELNTMPQWAGSCWYYLRYLDPSDEDNFVAPTIEKYWMGNGVDLYVGGVEHAVLHLLYSRFWHKVLFDRGLVSSDEPFRKLVNQGLILGEDGQKMSKSRGNVINPDDVIAHYGADSLRMFEMFMGPLDQVKPWSTAGVEGVYRFLQRVWRNLFDENDAPKMRPETPPDILRGLHRLIKKAGEDIERLSFNTAIAAMMEFNNLVAKSEGIAAPEAITFLRVLEPFAPHFAEEAYHRIAGAAAKTSISQLPWPSYDAALLIDATVEIPVQVNGKLRSRVSVPNDADEATAVAAALADAEVQKFLAGKEPRKKIFVKGRMVNLVV
ncbi:MAG TPA: leucine--tRNA ligase [Phycisphaerae bacterium]|nr:leucine--tRNA ligase [Phycisphaerae bacterium]